MTEYEDSLKVYRDLKGVVDTSFEEGEKIGIKKGIETGKNKMAEEMAKKSIKEGLSIDLISKLTGLSREEIEKLQ
jgi:predicted transposase/invertase (TIGR01784 family)